MPLQDSTRLSRLHFMTLRGLLYNTRWLAEDDSMRHHYLARITPWDTLTRRGRLNEGDSTRGWLEEDNGEDHSTRQDDSTRLFWVITRNESQNESRLFVTDICFANCVDEFFYFLFFYLRHLKSIILIIIDTFHFILLSAFLPVSFVTWMIINGVDGFLHFISRLRL